MPYLSLSPESKVDVFPSGSRRKPAEGRWKAAEAGRAPRDVNPFEITMSEIPQTIQYFGRIRRLREGGDPRHLQDLAGSFAMAVPLPGGVFCRPSHGKMLTLAKHGHGLQPSQGCRPALAFLWHPLPTLLVNALASCFALLPGGALVAAAGLVHAVAPARPKRNRGLGSACVGHSKLPRALDQKN